MDCVNQLPDEVLDLILSRISLRDRVKASVVSRRWNKICLSPSDIQLDWPNFLVTGNNDKVDKDNHDQLCPVYQGVFVNNVHQFLASFLGNHVRCLNIRFCLTRGRTDDIDDWVCFAVRMGVQSMSVLSYCYTRNDFCKVYHNDPELSLEDIQYVIRTELFDTPWCSLKDLRLGGCNLGPDFSKHLSGLKTLYISHSFLEQCDLQKMFSELPNLLELVFSRCDLPMELTLNCLPSLRTFKLIHCRGVQQIYLSHIKLSWFSVFTTRAIELHLGGAPNLLSLSCSATRMTMPYFFECIHKDAPMLTKLHVICHGQLNDCIPNNLEVFSKVTRLEWYCKPSSQLEIVKMVDILKAFPLLTMLLVVMSDAKNLEENHQLLDVSHKPEHLSAVMLCGFCGTSAQINFVAYLLKHATTLKQFIIKGKKTWGEAARQDFLSKIEGFDKDNVKVIIL